MKAFKKHATAAKYAGDLPIIKVGDLYIVGEGGLADMAHTTIAVLTKSKIGHKYAGQVTVRKLAALGNANWAARADNGEKIDIDWYGEKEKV
jgi:hypothetical protein